jgi:hypothetical protein
LQVLLQMEMQLLLRGVVSHQPGIVKLHEHTTIDGQIIYN